MKLRPPFLFLLVFLFQLSTIAQNDSDGAAAALADAAQQALAHGDAETARTDYEKLAKLKPEVAEIHATLGAMDFQQRRYAQAIAEIEEAQKLKPGLPRLNSLLGLSQAAIGHYRRAQPLLQKCFQQTADRQLNRLCGLQLMRVEQGLDEDADAVETALTLNRLYADDAEILYHTGRVFGSYAYEVMERLRDKAPNSVWMLLAQGEANEAAKNYSAAIVAYRHVLEQDPKRVGIHYRLGRMYLARYGDTQKAEDKQAAMREFAAELALDPSDGNALYEIANQEAESGQLEKARTDYQKLVERIPDFEQALVGLGGVEIEAGQFQPAADLLERATKLKPTDEVAWYRLFMARRGSHDEAGARVAMDEYRKLHSAEASNSGLRASDSSVTPQTLDKTAP